MVKGYWSMVQVLGFKEQGPKVIVQVVHVFSFAFAYVISSF